MHQLSIADQRREETYQEIKELLAVHGKCVFVRPTGFGKTGLNTRVLKEYQNVLYLYPAQVVRDAVLGFYYGYDKVPEDGKIPNVEFMTYAKLARMNEKDMRKLPQYDLIICDECHKTGAKETMKGLKILVDIQPDAHLLGATATPDRMDQVDPLKVFWSYMKPDGFPGIAETSLYTLHDAFQDGILKRPKYRYCNYRRKDKTVESLNKEIDDLRGTTPENWKEEQQKQALLFRAEQSLVEIANLHEMDVNIRRTCDEYVRNTNYMRFIVFFSSFDAIHQRGEQVKQWFHQAYPNHAIESLIVSSETEEYANNAMLLAQMQPAELKIDLIFCIDMINMGYHVPGLTGIMMCRGTKSGTIFCQQLGRALSTGAADASVVFDVVDNIHEDSLFTVLGHKSKFTTTAINRLKVLEDKKKEYDLYKAYQDGNTEELSQNDLNRFRGYDENPATAPVFTKEDAKELRELRDRFRSGDEAGASRQTLLQEDLIAVDLEAGYRDIIRKTVVEGRYMRGRQAWANWIENHGNPYDENGRILPRWKIKALTLPKYHPLAPYCECRNVTVDETLDSMGIME